MSRQEAVSTRGPAQAVSPCLLLPLTPVLASGREQLQCVVCEARDITSLHPQHCDTRPGTLHLPPVRRPTGEVPAQGPALGAERTGLETTGLAPPAL